MKIMIDTNIIISTVLFPKGRVAQAFFKALQSPYEPILCDYVVDELHRKFREKFPKDRPILRAALSAHADLFLTGDKDFLDSSLTDPRIVSVSDFLAM